MSDFRAALDGFVTGEVELSAAQEQLAAAVRTTPHMAPAMLATLDTYEREGRLLPDVALQLQALVKSSLARVILDGDQTHARPTASTSTTRLSLGSVLKGRFVLESVVAGGDKGGMGVVYKARDLIAQEAQDRHPYVAIKVLNEEFKRHPESMKALHRESRKAQTLSHPNIITVYTFDRDGEHVFMAMELLEGRSLDEVIRSGREHGGLPLREALRIIQGLGLGLGHAHANGIVHSDFKPSNAFLTNKDTVKVLDFGIAREAKVAGSGTGYQTLFDAGTLGALTMNYASCEQIERQTPDPTDDVYALAVVSYELLTGHHPFERPADDKSGRVEPIDAVSARDAKRKPAPINGLTRSQWRTLQNGLAFSRSARPRTASQFIDGLAVTKISATALTSAGTAAVLLIVVALFVVRPYMQRSKLQSLGEQLQSPDPATVATALGMLRGLSGDARASLLVNDAVQTRLYAYFDRRSHQAFDVTAGRYDYPSALAVLKQAQSLSKQYEDSRQLTGYIEQLESARKAEILQQAERFESLLKDSVLIPSQGRENALGALGIIAQLDPAYPLLNDKRLPIAFATSARTALDAGHVALAGDLLAAALRLTPRDDNLRDLKDRYERQRTAAELAARVAQIETLVATLGAPTTTLEDFRKLQQPVLQLSRSAPASKVLAAAQQQLSKLIAAVVSSGVQQHQVTDAQTVLGEFSDLLPASFVDIQRVAIGRVIGEAQAREASVQQLRTALAKLSLLPRSDDAWVSEAQRALRSLEALTGKDDAAAVATRAKASQVFLTQAQGLIADRRLSEAQRVLDLARDFGLEAGQYNAQASAIAQVRAQVASDNRESAAAAQLAAMKQRIVDQAAADRIDAAQALFSDLQKKLPATDSFVSSEGPRAIGNAYLSRAQKLAAQTRFADAIQAATAAQKAAPDEARFQIAAQSFQTARDLVAIVAKAPELGKLKPSLANLRVTDKDDYAFIEAGLLRAFIDRLNRVAAGDTAAAAQLRASAVTLFPNSSLPTIPLAHGQPAQPQAPGRTVQTAPQSSPAPVGAVDTSSGAGALTTNAAIPGNAPAAVPTAATSQPNAITPPEQAVKTARGSSDATVNACTADLAGKGQDRRAICRDALDGGGHGPDLVVIPPGAGLGLFAIMRNETSIAEYAAYCAATGCAAPADVNPRLPITSISVADAEKYAAWLSIATGVKYHLPSEQEWHRAAGTSKDLSGNCLVTVNGQVVRGSSLQPASSGYINDFGLANVVGNAQEWAKTTAGGWSALGGAIGDPMNICSTQLTRKHDGLPDGKTGFRLVREVH